MDRNSLTIIWLFRLGFSFIRRHHRWWERGDIYVFVFLINGSFLEGSASARTSKPIHAICIVFVWMPSMARYPIRLLCLSFLLLFCDKLVPGLPGVLLIQLQMDYMALVLTATSTCIMLLLPEEVFWCSNWTTVLHRYCEHFSNLFLYHAFTNSYRKRQHIIAKHESLRPFLAQDVKSSVQKLLR